MPEKRTVRWADYEIDLGELLWRMRHDLRYTLGVILPAILVLMACGLVLWPRPVPSAALYLSGYENVTLTTGRQTLKGAGPHTLPAGTHVVEVQAVGYYPAALELELAANATTTVTPTLHVRPAFQQITAGTPKSWVTDAFLTPDGVRFQIALSTTTDLGQIAAVNQWWRIADDGRRERLLALDSAAPFPAARNDESGYTAMASGGGLFVADVEGNISGPILTATLDVDGLAWWGEDLLLFRSTLAGVQVEILPRHLTETNRLALLPTLPDLRFVQASPDGGYLLLRIQSSSNVLLVLDQKGEVSYLADLPPTPLPWAFVAWEEEGVLVWTAPQVGPDGVTVWPISRLELRTGSSELLDAPAQVRGLWIEGEQVFFLDGQGCVRMPGGPEPLYTIEEIETSDDFALWKRGRQAILYDGGYYWLLSWTEK